MLVHVKKSLKNKTHRLLHKHKKAIIFAGFGVVAFGILFGTFLYASNTKSDTVGRLVTFHDRGRERVILTQAKTVQDALKDARIAVDAKDVVEPALGSELLSTDSVVIIYRARLVLVVDGAQKEKIMTNAQSPNELATLIGLAPIGEKDETKITQANFIKDGANSILTIKRAELALQKVVFVPKQNALTAARGAHIYTDANGVAHRETYYDLPMGGVMRACGGGDYEIRSDGAKIDKDGYVLVAANLGNYPRCSIVDTSLGLGKVYDTGGFALRHPHGFDLATDWSNRNGR